MLYITSVTQKSWPRAVVYCYCAWSAFLRNRHYISEDFAKFCGLLRIYELYLKLSSSPDTEKAAFSRPGFWLLRGWPDFEHVNWPLWTIRADLAKSWNYSQDHLFSFRCTIIQSYNSTTKFRYLLTNHNMYTSLKKFKVLWSAVVFWQAGQMTETKHAT